MPESEPEQLSLPGTEDPEPAGFDRDLTNQDFSDRDRIDRAELAGFGRAAPKVEGTPPAARARQRPVPRWLVIAGGVGSAVGAVAMLVLGRSSPAVPTEPAAAERAARPKPQAIVESAPPPVWLGSRTPIWTRDGSKTIGFELQASNEVAVWMTRMRPLLVVRCLSRTTEVFVLTGAASVETQGGTHTVRLQIDDDESTLQQWVDSESRQELFAPNSVALTKRLAQARRVRFGYTPYNAAPVVADFVVEGFDKLAGLVANTCGWKLDATSPRAHAANLN